MISLGVVAKGIKKMRAKLMGVRSETEQVSHLMNVWIDQTLTVRDQNLLHWMVDSLALPNDCGGRVCGSRG